MRTVCCLAAIALAAFPALAQEVAVPRHELSFVAGYSPDSTTAFGGTGRTANARFGQLSFRYSRRFRTGDVVNLKYIAEITPLAVVSTTGAMGGFSERTSSYGIGILPFGLQANFRPRKRIQPFVSLTTGFMYFDRRVPSVAATRFQFAAAPAFGVEVRLRDKHAVELGYRYFHISNGGRGLANPGIDNNFFYLGYSFFGK